jgi:hypothetical protein
MGELPKQLLIMSFLLDNVDIMREGDDRTWMARYLSLLHDEQSAAAIWPCSHLSRAQSVCSAYHNIPMHPDNSGTRRVVSSTSRS